VIRRAIVVMSLAWVIWLGTALHIAQSGMPQ
jgi:hypothetical protein